jgi:hypothetical protein
VPFQFSRFISFRFISIFISFFTRQNTPLLGVKLFEMSVLRCRTAAAHITSKKGGIYCHIALICKGLGPVGAPIHSCTAQQVYCQGRSLQHQVPRMGFLGKTNHQSSNLQLLYVFMHATINNKAVQTQTHTRELCYTTHAMVYTHCDWVRCCVAVNNCSWWHYSARPAATERYAPLLQFSQQTAVVND